MPIPVLPAVGLVLAASLALGACSPLTAFATLTPTDPAEKAGAAIAYGPGPRQRLDVYRPPEAGEAAAPLAVFFYGGSWRDGRRQDYGWVGRALAAEGFVTLVPDYRLYPEVAYPDFLEDGAGAIAWAVSHAAELGADPQRIVLVGHSAGAYNAVMLGLDGRYLDAAGVDPGAIRAVAGLAGPYDFLPLEGRLTPPIFGAAADLEATQPLAHASRRSPPAFLGTGEDDQVVEARNTLALAQALRDQGAVVETALYPDLGHAGVLLALSRPLRGRAPVLDDMVAFLRRQVGLGDQVAMRNDPKALP